MKIYSDDLHLLHKTTKLKALYTKSEIVGYSPNMALKMFISVETLDHNDVFVRVKIDEEIDGVFTSFG